ncbi:hypothetical protein [Deinococcus roseus]|uniref:Uncharacterized protein n=1 Tax=Deinococcus roseus TaxID=392414 RepID=A0ABQ2CU06_9DEIO|nr:hypothetical protein [Deinococcus roseus]GGJ19399.1 hypothetical protein GCM10008938_01880 [Deinococcus roseus]
MNAPDPDQRSENLSLETRIAAELTACLEQTAVGAEFKVEPAADLSSALEFYLPQLLSQHHSEWEWESLDGVLTTSAIKLDADTAELSGMCILISDQTVTPFFIRLQLSSSHDSIAAYRVLLGEPGGGRLGISGPICTSDRAQILLITLKERLQNIRWVYRIESTGLL